jgi:hypothetical protein
MQNGANNAAAYEVANDIAKYQSKVSAGLDFLGTTQSLYRWRQRARLTTT